MYIIHTLSYYRLVQSSPVRSITSMYLRFAPAMGLGIVCVGLDGVLLLPPPTGLEAPWLRRVDGDDIFCAARLRALSLMLRLTSSMDRFGVGRGAGLAGPAATAVDNVTGGLGGILYRFDIVKDEFVFRAREVACINWICCR